MKRKFLKLMLVCALCGSLAACGENIEDTAVTFVETSSDSTEISDTSETSAETLFSETVLSSETSVSSEVISDLIETAAETSEEATVSETQSDIADDGLSSYTDEQLLLVANSLFSTASQMCWDCMSGRLFKLDEINMQEFTNSSGNTECCFKVTESGISSVSDVKAYWHKFFSERYDDMYSEYLSVYRDENGELWARVGDRGSDIFYDYTLLSEIAEKSDDEVVFNAISYYSDPDTGLDQYTQENKFSIVLKDGEWYIGTFTLPY